jgi:hypothetical protein
VSGTQQIADERLAGTDGIGDQRDALRPHLDRDLRCAGSRFRGHVTDDAAARRTPIVVVVYGRADQRREEQKREAQGYDALQPVRPRPRAGIAPWNTVLHRGVLCGPSHGYSVREAEVSLKPA